MSNTNKKRSFLTLAALAMAADSGGFFDTHPMISQTETKEERKKRLLKAEENRNIDNGLTQYYYGDNFVWARDQRNADRKAKNNGWIK